MSKEHAEPPTVPRPRLSGEAVRLQSTECFVGGNPDPTSQRAIRMKERLEGHKSDRRHSSKDDLNDKPRSRKASDQPSAAPPAKRDCKPGKQPAKKNEEKRGPGRPRRAENHVIEQEEKRSEEETVSAEEEEASSSQEEKTKKKKLPKDGIVECQVIFGDKQPSKRDQDGALEFLKELYPEVRQEYDDAVKAELAGNYLRSLETNNDSNKFRANLLKNYVAPELKFAQVNNSSLTSTVTFIKPDVNELGERVKQMKIPCSRMEIGDLRPPMTYWVPIETSITVKDRRRLTHLPYFEDDQDDREINEALLDKFPEGIHGHGNNYEYINDWILYKMMRKAFETFDGNPDLLYYNLYRLWPNKLTQTELCEEFPKLCKRFAEPSYDVRDAEKWKPDPEQIVAQNLLKQVECYACLNRLCVIHGFNKDIDCRHFPEGTYYDVTVPLPNPTDDKCCSQDCWKKFDLDEAVGRLQPTREELEQFSVATHILKYHLAIEDGEKGLLLLAYAKTSIPSLCEFFEKYVDPDDDSCQIRSCRGLYELILNKVKRLDDCQLEMGRPQKQDDHQVRSQLFRKNQLAINSEKTDTSSDTKFDIVAPIHGCDHTGPCSKDNEKCTCAQNGVCSHLCKCDINCQQRFPGCNCTPGSCRTNACQCFRVKWECNPLTCKACRCESHDGRGVRCGNYSMTRLVSKRLIIAPSKIAGNGLFLLDSADKDEFITEYVGERITDDEAERRGAIYDRYKCSYIFNLGTGGAIDSNNLGNMSRFANHDKVNPTVYARTMVVAGEHRIGFFAKRKLEPNEELTFDYGYSREHEIGSLTTDTSKGRKKNKNASSADNV